ncbi:MAG: DUF1893 domain-containing protein [Deltaproteobacteria bacterium]|nr:DUF1893 domain-containing protein [Deltaproteobacteria bacterium]
MLIPDFSRYSLALFEGNKLIYSSEEKGVRPLFDCLEKHKNKSGLILHDKVIGLAAAKLIVYSGIISEVITTIASIPAKKFLEDNGIIITAYEVTANILTKDRNTICPGEVIALNAEAPDDFSRKIKKMLNG